MTNSTELHDIIFVTDKYGRRNKTGDIEKLQYDSRKDVYFITYKDGKTYPCKSSDLQIIKNSLKDKQSAIVFDYANSLSQRPRKSKDGHPSFGSCKRRIKTV